MSAHGKSKRPAPDQLFVDIAKYVTRKTVGTRAAYLTARYCLMDAISCALDALDSPECMSLVGPLVPGATMKGGARVPGTRLELDPVAAAFNTGCLIRWLDFNDTWWAGGHPSDNYSAILSVADYVSRARIAARQKPLSMVEALTAAIQAYEIQGVLAMGTDFDDIGLDHVMLIKMASAAVCTRLLGGSVARAVRAFGFPVRGWSRSPRAIDGVACFSGRNALAEFLAGTRFLVCLLPLTDETQNLLCRATLSLLPRGASLVNLARGHLLVDEDLIALLDSGHLSAATLDVFRSEPLPETHPFWSHPKVSVTPHIAAQTLRHESLAQIAEKIRLLESGQAVSGIVERKRGY